LFSIFVIAGPREPCHDIHSHRKSPFVLYICNCRPLRALA
jgi:hypothetical protein